MSTPKIIASYFGEQWLGQISKNGFEHGSDVVARKFVQFQRLQLVNEELELLLPGH